LKFWKGKKMFKMLEDCGYKRINSEAEAYQLLRWYFKKKRLHGAEIRFDKRLYSHTNPLNIEVGAYYKIWKHPLGGRFFQVYGKNSLTYMIDRARELAATVGDVNPVYSSLFKNDSIEGRCEDYLIDYFLNGGTLEGAAEFGSMANEIFDVCKDIKNG